MASAIRDKALVVIQLSGGNDCLNTVVPYTNGLYYDFRPTVNIAAKDVLPIDDAFGFNPSMESIKRLWDEGKVAIINGIGYPHPDRSHFRSMDIWHTAEPEKIGKEGWLGRAIRTIDPKGDNVLTGINFGRDCREPSGAGGFLSLRWETSRPMAFTLTCRRSGRDSLRYRPSPRCMVLAQVEMPSWVSWVRPLLTR
jgi:uncharacterized protein (DUF1501 family)